MPTKGRPLVLRSLLGRNGADPSTEIPDDMAAEMTNVDFFDGGLCQKRPGAANVTLNGFSAGGTVTSLMRYVPADVETNQELHVVDSDVLTTFQRLAGGTTWATYTLADAYTSGDDENVEGITFNGKLFQAYNSTVNRLHVYPSAGGTHRRVGLAQPAAPTTALAAGAVTDVRRYAVCWTEQVSGSTVRRSNLGTATGNVTLTAQQVTVTRPTAPSDGETHWELYVFSDDDNYATGFLRTTTAIATTTAVDNTVTLSGAAPPSTGANTPPPSPRYLLTDGAHLIMAGAWETAAGDGITPSTRRIWWTPAIGTSDTDGDDERIVNTTDVKNFLDVEASITGLGGPIQGNVLVFGYHHVWKLVPTGENTAAYQRITLRSDIGCIDHRSIVMGEDEQGRSALYWLSHKGPYRLGAEGIQFLGRDVQDRWAVVNLEATTRVGLGYYLSDKQQVHWHVAVSSNNTPNEKLVFDVRLGRVTEFRNVRTVRYGWTRQTGRVTEAVGAVLFSNTLGASMSRDLKPYLGRVGTGISAPTIWRGDVGTTDAGTTYASSFTTKDYTLLPGRLMSMPADALLLADTSAGVTLTLTTNRDFSAETATSTVLLTAAGSETKTFPKFEGAQVSEAAFVRFTVGDAAAADNTWVLDELVTSLTVDDRK